jgi:hypothetical protein
VRRSAGGAAATARMVWRCLPIDARRPASWLAAACGGFSAACAGGTCGSLVREGAATGWAPAPSLAIAAGTAAALAAIGDPPGATTRPRGDWRLLTAVTLSRAAWPVVGAAVAAVAGAPGAVAVPLGGAIVAAAATTVVLRRAGADAAEAAGATLFATATASAVAAAAPPGLALPAAAAAWTAVVGTAVAWARGGARPAEWTGTELIEAIGWPAASGRLGGGLVAASMIMALLGMAAWLFLAPERSAWYGGLTVACFVALAVPRATLAWGAVGAARRGLVLATAACPPPGGPRLARRLDRLVGAGFLGPEWRVPLSAAAILGWPALVAAGVVGGGDAVDRLRLVAALFAWAAGLVVGTALVLRAGASRETALAVALAVALVACGLAAGLAARGKSLPWAFSTWATPENAEGFRGCRSPHPASAEFIHSLLETPQNPRNDGRTGVEESGASCETPQPRWPADGGRRSPS